MRNPARLALAVLLAGAVALPATALAGPTAGAARHHHKRHHKTHHKRGPRPVKGGKYAAGSNANGWYVDIRVSKSGRTAKARFHCVSDWSTTRSFKIGRRGTFSAKGRKLGLVGFTIKGRFRSRNAAHARVHPVLLSACRTKRVTLKLKK